MLSLFRAVHFFISICDFSNYAVYRQHYPGSISGYLAKPEQYPWHVALISNIGVYCEGALISNKWVITAATCVSRAKRVKVILGTNNFSKKKVKRRIQNIVVHPEFEPSNIFQKDIALTEMKEAVEFSPSVNPISLPPYSMSVGRLYTHDLVKVGFGYRPIHNKKNSGKKYPKILRQVNLRIKSESDEECNNLLWRNYDDGTFCTELSNLNDNECLGSRGTPVVYYQNNIPYLIGVTSIRLGECQSGISGYQSIHSNIEWIAKVTGIETSKI